MVEAWHLAFLKFQEEEGVAEATSDSMGVEAVVLLQNLSYRNLNLVVEVSLCPVQVKGLSTVLSALPFLSHQNQYLYSFPCFDINYN